MSGGSGVDGGFRLGSPPVTVVVAILLVIAANVGNLILARSFARAREFSLRAALGASRVQLVAQVTLEVLLIAGVAATIGTIGPERLILTPQGRLVIVDAGANLIRFIPAGAY